MDSLNDTVLPSHDTYNSDLIILIKAPMFTLAFVLGMFGNVTVVIATIKCKSLRQPTNILICILCICDIAILILGIPLFILGNSNYLMVCKVTRPLHAMLVSATVITLLVIAIERYVFIVHPIKRSLKFTKTKIIIFIILLFILSILSGLPCLFSLLSNPTMCSRNAKPETITNKLSMFIFQYLIPILVMFYLYSMSWYHIRKKNRKSIWITRSCTPSPRTSFVETQSASISKEMINQQNGAPFSNSLLQESLSKSISMSNGINQLSPFDSNRQAKRTHSLDSDSKRPTNITRALGEMQSSKVRNLGNAFSQTQRSLASLIIGIDIEMPTEFAVKRSKQTILTLKMFIYIVFVFAVCMLPHHVLALLRYTNNTTSMNFYEIFNIFVYINTAINPWVYGCMNNQYIISIKKLFCAKETATERADRFRHCSTNSFGNISMTGYPSETSHVYSPHYPSKLNIEDNKRKHGSAYTWCLKYIICRKGGITSSKDLKDNALDLYLMRPRQSISGRGNMGRRPSVLKVKEDIPVCAPIIIITSFDEEEADF